MLSKRRELERKFVKSIWNDDDFGNLVLTMRKGVLKDTIVLFDEKKEVVAVIELMGITEDEMCEEKLRARISLKAKKCLIIKRVSNIDLEDT